MGKLFGTDGIRGEANQYPMNATMAFDVLLNGYPVMLQRYNRALLARRFGAPAATGG